MMNKTVAASLATITKDLKFINFKFYSEQVEEEDFLNTEKITSEFEIPVNHFSSFIEYLLFVGESVQIEHGIDLGIKENKIKEKLKIETKENSNEENWV